MRQVADASKIRRFMREFGRAARRPARVYLTGGATAVLEGWRTSTIDIDLKLVPDDDALLRAIPELKESLQVNIELAAPNDFIPVPDGWEDRGRFIAQEGPLAFYSFDLTAQALSKIERGHEQDLGDVREMLRRGLVTKDGLLRAFKAIEPLMYRYPSVDPATFRRTVEEFVRSVEPGG